MQFLTKGLHVRQTPCPFLTKGFDFRQHFIRMGLNVRPLARACGAFLAGGRIFYPRRPRMCPPVGLAGQMLEFIRFRLKIVTVLVDRAFGIIQEAPRRHCKIHWRQISRRHRFNTRLRINTRLRFNTRRRFDTRLR